VATAARPALPRAALRRLPVATARRAGAAALAATVVTLAAWTTGDWWRDGFAGQERNLTVARIVLFAATFGLVYALPGVWARSTRAGRIAFAGWGAYLGLWLLGQWPGIVMTDSVDSVANAREGVVYDYFSYVHALLHLVVLDVVPHVALLTVLQVLATAGVLAWATAIVHARSRSRWPVAVMTLAAALSAPVVVNTLLLSRDTLYGVLHLALALWVARVAVDRHPLRPTALAGLATLTAVLGVYRGDGVVLLAVVPLVLLVALRPSPRAALLGAGVFAAAILVVGLALPATLAERSQNPNFYKLTLRINPLGAVLNTDFYSEDKGRDLAELGRVIDVEGVREKYTPAEIPAYWDGEWNRAATDADFAVFEAAADRVLRNNLGTVVESRVRTFGTATGLTPGGFTGAAVPDAFPERTSWIADAEGISAEPPLQRLYFAQADVLQETAVFDGIRPSGQALHFNLLPWLLLLAAAMLAVRRAPFAAVVALVVLSRVPLVFLAAPAGQHKYYYSVHLAGIVVLGLFLAAVRWSDLRRRVLPAR